MANPHILVIFQAYTDHRCSCLEIALLEFGLWGDVWQLSPFEARSQRCSVDAECYKRFLFNVVWSLEIRYLYSCGRGLADLYHSIDA